MRSAGRTAACVLGLAMTAAVTACGHPAGADVVVAPAATRTLHIAPAGIGTVLPGTDHAVILERRATVIAVDVVEGALVRQGQLLLEVVTIGQSSEVTAAANQLWADQKRLQAVRTREGANGTQALALFDQIARDRQVLANLRSSPTAITAPNAGRVSGLAARPGAAMDRTNVVLHLVDERTVRVTVPVAADYRGQLAPGRRAELSLPDRPGQSFGATVVGVGPTALSEPGGDSRLPVTVTVPNPAGVIPLGSQAYVRFAEDRSASVAVDSVAVLGLKQQPFVFVVDRGRARQRAVVVGASDGSWTEISSGVAVGQDVVISGGQRLVDGAPIHVSRGNLG